jgi:hypothetical protein
MTILQYSNWHFHKRSRECRRKSLLNACSVLCQWHVHSTTLGCSQPTLQHLPRPEYISCQLISQRTLWCWWPCHCDFTHSGHDINPKQCDCTFQARAVTVQAHVTLFTRTRRRCGVISNHVQHSWSHQLLVQHWYPPVLPTLSPHMLNTILAYTHMLAAQQYNSTTHWQWLHFRTQQPVLPAKQWLSHHHINTKAGWQSKLVQPQEPSHITVWQSRGTSSICWTSLTCRHDVMVDVATVTALTQLCGRSTTTVCVSAFLCSW